MAQLTLISFVCRSVRFGTVGGKTRLLVACQNKSVYVFEVGSGCVDSASKDMPCQQVHAGTQEEEVDNQKEPRMWRSAEVGTLLDTVLSTCRCECADGCMAVVVMLFARCV